VTFKVEGGKILKDEGTAARAGAGEMHERRTTLADGRYLIYYTFGDEPDAASETGDEAPERAPDAEPSAEEERRV
jgi:hypothetical protein